MLIVDELDALRKMVESHDYEGALRAIDELDEMAKDDKINKVESFLVILLIHLINQHAEQRTTSSWQRSINNALFGIAKSNKRRNAKGYYLTPDELKAAIEESFAHSLEEAASEAFGGAFSARQLAEKIDQEKVKELANELVINYKLP